MTSAPTSQEQLKQQAGLLAAGNIQSDMKVGLGTGSTVFFTLQEISRRIQQENLKIDCAVTSLSTQVLCQQFKIPVRPMNEFSRLDYAVDGADEIDPQRNLIKGRGGAHTLEKIVASMADTFVVVADSSKKVKTLGAKFPVPIEALFNAFPFVTRKLELLGAKKIVLRSGAPGKDGPVITDNGNIILDAWFDGITEPQKLDQSIRCIPGVVDNGLFCGLANRIILATSSGIEQF